MIRFALFVVCLQVSLLLAYDFPPSGQISTILRNDRLLKSYHECLIDKAPCPPEGKKLKKILPDVVQGGCQKCTDSNKSDIKTILSYLIEKKPDLWTSLTAKYDPKKEHKTRLAKLLQVKDTELGY